MALKVVKIMIVVIRVMVTEAENLKLFPPSPRIHSGMQTSFPVLSCVVLGRVCGGPTSP